MSEDGSHPAIDGRLRTHVDHIAEIQREDGLIPWYPDGPADPWDHVESAMGLSIGGETEAAKRAYEWLARCQPPDGSWWAVYDASGSGEQHRSDGGDGGNDGDEPRKEPHRTAYVAVGVWHHYRITGDRAFLATLWSTVRDALEFALAHQAPGGEIHWAVDADGEVYEDALVTASASIYKSLECGAAIAAELDRPGYRDRWLRRRARLGAAIRSRPGQFDRTWESKGRYAMDWFYPVLCGVLTGEEARSRLEADLDRFLETEWGCRCVADEPWVTVAESCELVVSLATVGRRERARQIFEWLFRLTDETGRFLTGYQLETEEFWPENRPSWTAGAALLAADALEGLTPASRLFLESAPEVPATRIDDVTFRRR